MSYTDLIIEMLSHVTDGNRKTILGSHPDLETFKGLYEGKTPRHTKDVVKEGKKVKTTLMTTNFGKTVCQDLAGAFLNEKMTINVGKEKQNELMQEILYQNKFFDRINPFGEKYFGLGYGETSVMPRKIFYDEESKVILKDETNGVIILFNDAVKSIPITREYGDITECGIVVDKTDGVIVQLHLLNERGYYDVFECKAKADKDGHEKFDYENLKVWHTTSTKPLFQAWFPNVSDSKHLDNPNGTSILATSEDDLLLLDTMFDSLNTEISNGEMMKFISYDLKVLDPLTGDYVNVPLSSGERYVPSVKEGATNLVSSFAPKLRNEQIQNGMVFVMNRIGANAGLGTSNYEMGVQGRPLQTATAVLMKESTKGQTILKNESLAARNIKDLLMSIKYVYNTFVADTFTFEYNDIEISFEDNIMEDTTAKKEQDLKEVSAGIKSIAEYRSTWYGESKEDAEKFVKENGLLIEKYMSALQLGAITPKKFVEIVYGDDNQEMITYIESKLSSPAPEMNFDDESNGVDE